MIHRGNHEIGHYYSFNFDLNKKVWWRCNDISVKEETEEIVFKEAFGI